MPWVIEPPPQPAVAVAGTEDRFPVRRLYCVGRNYGAHATEMGGNPARTGFTAPTILWVREHEPAVFAKTAHVLLPKDYIRLKMTGASA